MHQVELTSARFREHAASSRPGAGPDRPEPVLSTAETAECTCPEFCERDHTNE